MLILLFPIAGKDLNGYQRRTVSLSFIPRLHSIPVNPCGNLKTLVGLSDSIIMDPSESLIYVSDFSEPYRAVSEPNKI